MNTYKNILVEIIDKNLSIRKDKPIRVYRNHDPNEPIGTVAKVTVNEDGMYMDIESKFVLFGLFPSIMYKVNKIDGVAISDGEVIALGLTKKPNIDDRIPMLVMPEGFEYYDVPFEFTQK